MDNGCPSPSTKAAWYTEFLQQFAFSPQDFNICNLVCPCVSVIYFTCFQIFLDKFLWEDLCLSDWKTAVYISVFLSSEIRASYFTSANCVKTWTSVTLAIGSLVMLISVLHNELEVNMFDSVWSWCISAELCFLSTNKLSCNWTLRLLYLKMAYTSTLLVFCLSRRVVPAVLWYTKLAIIFFYKS